ncbi:MAG: DNA polymerase I [Eubacteriales bacterium]|nr:DNA polymerase I [Eubacteriales bacterium]
MSEKLMLIDGNSILNRAFYGLQMKSADGSRSSSGMLLKTSGGIYTNAVYGFVNILNMHLEAEDPDYICVAFDMKGKTFRHADYKDYKGKRKGMPEELAVQVPVIKEVLDAMNIKRLEFEGFEADDIIGSVSYCAEKENIEVIIVTGDRDELQLASDGTRIRLTVSKAGKPFSIEYNKDVFEKEYGISPIQLIDLKGLMGDQSDSIPGVKGVGEKTALKLIRKYGTIQNIYENLEDIENIKLRKKLEDGREMAFLSRKLAKIERGMSQICGIGELKREQFNKKALLKKFRDLEFEKLIIKMGLEEENKDDYVKKTAVIIKTRDVLKQISEQIRKTGEFALYPIFSDTGKGYGEFVGTALCFSFDKRFFVRFEEEINLTGFLNIFGELLSSPDIKKYGHDLKKLIVTLKNLGIPFEGLAFDTMIASYILDPSKQNNGINELALAYLHESIEPIGRVNASGSAPLREEETEASDFESAAGAYAEAIFRIKPVMEKLLAENHQEYLYNEIELPLVEVLADMEFRGFKINSEVLKKLSSELEEKIISLAETIYFAAGERFNINSTKQLGEILFEKLRLPVIKKTKTGYSTDADVLEHLSKSHDIVDRILEYRKLMKLKSTYVDGLLSVVDQSTGKIHSSFNQTIVITGRISSTDPNLQNIPIKEEIGRKIRKVFVPSEESFILTDADYSQIELRILAHISGDENMISAFKNGEDIHTSTAAKIFNINQDQVTAAMRNNAKAVNFGIIYGIGDYSLSQNLGISRNEAGKYIKDYLDRYPGVRKYMRDIIEKGGKDGYVATLFNRIRYIPELKSGNFNIRSFGERIALNTPIQGTAADIIKIAMVKVYKRLKDGKMKSRLILQVHDELIVETHVDEKEEVIEIVRECMEKAIELKVPLSVDIKTGNSWYETK